MAPALPRKIPAGSRPDRRSPSRAASADSIGVAALHGQNRREQHCHPEKAGGGRGEDLPVGAERQAEQEQDGERERADLVQSDPGAHLDPQVLAGDEHRVTQHEQVLP